MSVNSGEGERYQELVDTAVQAMWNERYKDSIEGFTEAILLRAGVVPPEDNGRYKLPSYFDRKTGYVSEVAELAVPKEAFGWNVQRVMVERLEVGRKQRLPGVYVTQQYNIGGVTAIVVGHEGETRMKIRKYGRVDEVEFRNVGTKRHVCGVMNLAVQQGEVVPPNKIGKKTFREHLRTAGAYMGYYVTERLIAEDEDDDW